MATDPQMLTGLSRGHAALAAGEWEKARDAFRAAVAVEESAEAWEGLGWAAWWLADSELTFHARERAYRSFRAEGDVCGAARVAAWLSADYREYRGEDAVGRGWLERAGRLIEAVPECADHGWVTLLAGDFALNAEGDVVRAGELAARAVAIGRELHVSDLEAVGLAMEGMTLVLRGRVEEGMRQLDEASAIAAAEELQLPLSQAWSLCYLVSACDGVGDFPRAAQWCTSMREFTARWGGRQILGVCRSAYGRVLTTSGDWSAGEAELTAAVDDLEAARPGMAGGGLVRLGELRARQGRTDEARELFTRAGHHPLALVGLGELALAAADPRGAADAAERALRALSPDSLLVRAPALALLVRAQVALGDDARAAAAWEELERAAVELQTPYILGHTRLVAATLAASRDDHDAARRCCEDAIDRFSEAAAPYECALARLELATALEVLGRDQAAVAEREAAQETFVRLGAVRDAERAREAFTPERGELSGRELEVLRLVAQGLNDGDIAARLVLSKHTVHRHVANIRVKLRQPSRAAAVAHAARTGLL